MKQISHQPLNRFILQEFKERLERERLEHEIRRKQALAKVYELRQRMKATETK